MKKRRFLPLPTIRWELISCALHGHFLVGTNAATLRPEDAVFARESGGLRLYRCLRCSSWVLRQPPRSPQSEFAPNRTDIDLPIRGRLLRDRYVLRLIAADRAVHVILLSLLAILIFLFTTHQDGLRNLYFQIFQGFQGVNNVNGDVGFTRFLAGIGKVFDFKKVHIIEVGLAISLLACIEAVEMVGLWRGRRWAEYLTFVATILFIPYEISELIHGISIIKLAAFAINVAIAGYLLYAKRLFGINGGGKGEARERRHDSGWAYLQRTSPSAK